MQKELCNILANKLLGLEFVQVLAGMVQTVSKQEQDEGNSAVFTRRFPVATDTNLTGCEDPTGENDLQPDSSRASIIYFEDFGIATAGYRGRFQVYNSSIRLVCWLNKSKLYADPVPGNVTGPMIAKILDRLENANPLNVGMFQRLTVRLSRIPPQDAGIFGRYTYTETDRQYLRPPFDFFAIDLTAKFEINPACLS